jgi:hypothetical protein
MKRPLPIWLMKVAAAKARLGLVSGMRPRATSQDGSPPAVPPFPAAVSVGSVCRR